VSDRLRRQAEEEDGNLEVSPDETENEIPHRRKRSNRLDSSDILA